MTKDDEIRKKLNEYWDDNKTVPVYEQNAQKAQIELIADKNISLAKFKCLAPFQYAAHPDTIAAVKKDMLFFGDEYLDHARELPCLGCGSLLEWHFWHHCPYCGQSAPTLV